MRSKFHGLVILPYILKTIYKKSLCNRMRQYEPLLTLNCMQVTVTYIVVYDFIHFVIAYAWGIHAP